MPKKKSAIAEPTRFDTVIDLVDPKKCHPSPANNRNDRTVALGDLIASIRSQGLIQFPVLRPHPTISGEYEIVAGERRCRACTEIDGMKMPAIIKHLTDKEAHEITITENMQREQLSPLEEAQGIDTLLQDGATLEEVADRLGKSKQWVARRAKLNSLSPLWKREITSESGDGVCTWSAGHLLLIARFEHHIQDQLFIKHFQNTAFTSKLTIADLQRSIEYYMMQLKTAPWKLDDGKLVPEAGACSSCVKRSVAQTNLFEPEVEQDQIVDFCLDCECWKVKMVAHIEKTAAKLSRKDKDLITMVSYTGYDDYLSSDHPLQESARRDYELIECDEDDPRAVSALVVNGHEAGTVKKVKPRFYVDDGSGDEEEELTPEEKKEEREERVRELVIEKVAAEVQGIVEAGVLPGSRSIEEKMYFAIAAGEYAAVEVCDDSDEEDESCEAGGHRFWKEYAQLKKEEATLLECVDRMVLSALGSIKDNLARSWTTWGGFTIEDTIRLCDFLDIDFAEILDAAQEEITE